MSISVSIFRSSKIRNIQIRSFNTSASKALHWATVRRQDIEKANEHIRKMEEGHKRALAELPDYKKWSNEDLIKRVTELEYSLKLKTSQLVNGINFYGSSL